VVEPNRHGFDALVVSAPEGAEWLIRTSSEAPLTARRLGCFRNEPLFYACSVSNSASSSANPSARTMLPAAEPTRAVPTIGATAARTP
jgi:hypothetical protein